MPMIWCDNVGAAYLSAKRILHAHTNYVEVQVADVFPKPLFTFFFTVFRFKFQVKPPPSA